MISATAEQNTTEPPAAAMWVSISAYARIYSVTRVTVYKWIDADLLQWYRVGAVVRIKNLPPKSV